MTLDQAKAMVGASVVYLPSLRHGQIESGTIMSVNDAYVFVRYGRDTGSKATRPEDLEPEVRR